MFLLSIMWLESMLIPITTITSCTASVRLRLNLGRPCTDPPWSWPCYPPCPPCPHCPCWCQPCRWSLHSSLPLQLHYGKREAEAEAEADPVMVHHTGVHHPVHASVYNHHM